MRKTKSINAQETLIWVDLGQCMNLSASDWKLNEFLLKLARKTYVILLISLTILPGNLIATVPSLFSTHIYPLIFCCTEICYIKCYCLVLTYSLSTTFCLERPSWICDPGLISRERQLKRKCDLPMNPPFGLIGLFKGLEYFL